MDQELKNQYPLTSVMPLIIKATWKKICLSCHSAASFQVELAQVMRLSKIMDKWMNAIPLHLLWPRYCKNSPMIWKNAYAIYMSKHQNCFEKLLFTVAFFCQMFQCGCKHVDTRNILLVLSQSPRHSWSMWLLYLSSQCLQRLELFAKPNHDIDWMFQATFT